MGYNIIFVPIYIFAKHFTSLDTYESDDMYEVLHDCAVAKSCLSYYFSHKAKNGESFKDYLYLPNIAGHSTEKLVSIFGEILGALYEKGWVPEISKSEDMNTFTYNVKSLYDLCNDNKECVMIVDYIHSIHLTKDDISEAVLKQEEKRRQKMIEKNKSFTPIEYIHPKRGKILVKDYKTCTEIYVQEYRNKGDFKKWKDLCDTMPDAPDKILKIKNKKIEYEGDDEYEDEPDIHIFDAEDLEDGEDD